jgi:hypothetical protein
VSNDLELYPYADELLGYLNGAKAAAERAMELALMSHGPLTDAERRELRSTAMDIALWVDDAKTAVVALQDAIDF